MAASKDLRVLMVQRSRKNLETITALCESGKMTTVIDKRYPLSQVPQALRYLGENCVKGKLVITVQ